MDVAVHVEAVAYGPIAQARLALQVFEERLVAEGQHHASEPGHGVAAQLVPVIAVGLCGLRQREGVGAHGCRVKTVEAVAAAQDESIFRRTNIALSLYQFHAVGENYGLKQREERYPLDYNFGGIYSPEVTVFRKSESDGCELLEDPFKVDVITVSAIKNPTLKDGHIVPWVCDTLMNKIRQIFDMAIANGNDSLVLGAFGCGAYGTPPEHMANLFKKVLENEKYKTAFRVVSFAIIDDKNAYKAHNPEGNLKPFKFVFDKYNF